MWGGPHASFQQVFCACLSSAPRLSAYTVTHCLSLLLLLPPPGARPHSGLSLLLLLPLPPPQVPAPDPVLISMIEHGKRDARTWATTTGLAAYLAGTLFVPKEPAAATMPLTAPLSPHAVPLSPQAAPLSPLAASRSPLAVPARPPQRRTVSEERRRPETRGDAATNTQKVEQQHASSYYSPAAAAALDASTAGSPGSCPDTAGIFVEVSGGGGQRVLASSAVAWDEGAGVYTARVRLKPPAGESSARLAGGEGGVSGGSSSEQVEAVASIPSAGIVEIVGAGAAAGTAMAVGAAAAGTAATAAVAAAAGTAATVVGAAPSSTDSLEGPLQWASPAGRTVTIRVKGQGGAPDTLVTLEI